MLEHLLGEILSLIGICVVFYFAFSAILRLLLWLLHVASRPLEPLDRWLKSHAPPRRTYTRADHVRGWALVCVIVCVTGLALQLTVGLH